MAACVLVVGSINMDLIVRCERLPARGETIHGDALRTAPGGKGANQAVSCSRLGARTLMVGRVGEDEFGAKLRAGLATEGVNVDSVRVDQEVPSGTALILLEQDGQNRIIVMKGANASIGEEEVAVAQELLAGVDVVLMPLEVPVDTVRAVAAAARAQGVCSVLDAGPATPDAVAAGLPAAVDVFSPNQIEAEAFTGLRVRNATDARQAARRLIEMGARDVVIKLGDQGAYWLGEEGEHHAPAFAVDPVDTTAAGDAFTACLAVSIAQGTEMPEALGRANAAGALACLTLGAQPSMPTVEAVEGFLQERTG